MTVYVDDMRAKFGRMVMCHMLADTESELHAMADAIGVARRWYQRDHYDISLSKRAAALARGAIEITVQQAVMVRRRRRTPINGYTLGNPRSYEPMFVDPGFCKAVGGAYFPTVEAARAALEPDGSLPRAWFGDLRLPGRVYALHGAVHDGTCDEVGAARLTQPAFLSRVGGAQ